MGNANSRSVNDNLTDMITDQTINIINDQTITALSSQSITIKDTKKDVIITDNTFTGNATIDFSSLMNAITSQKVQQELMQKITNQAEAVNKDLNLFQYSNSNAILKNYVEAAIILTTNSLQKCSATTTQSQMVDITTTGGSVYVTNNTFQTTSKLVGECIQNATAEQASIQKLDQTLTNTAKSLNQGVNIWAIVVLAIIALLFTCVPIVLGTWEIEGTIMMIINILLKMLFLMFFLGGIILIILYLTEKKNTIVTSSGTQFISELRDQCGATEGKRVPDFNNITDAGKECLHSGYAGFDFSSVDGKTNTIFYSSMNPQCQNSVKNSSSDVQYIQVKAPKVGLSYPNLDEAKFKDLFLNINDGYLYMAKKKQQESDDKNVSLTWYPVKDSSNQNVKYLPEDKIGNINVANIKFKYGDVTYPDNDDDIYITIPYLSTLNNNLSYPWTLTAKNAVSEEKIPPDEFNYEVVDNSKVQNVSGFNIKIKKHSAFFLAIGISLTIVGVIGTCFQFFGGSSGRTKIKSN
jgi:hypothetical protein